MRPTNPQIDRFIRKLVEVEKRYRENVDILRAKNTNIPPPSSGAPDILEHNTRRHLIDGILEVLGWSMSDPRETRQEFRAQNPTNGWLYMDYVGFNPETNTPLFLVEAKRADLSLFSIESETTTIQPNRDRRLMIAAALNAIKAEEIKKARDIIGAEWTNFLVTQKDYVSTFNKNHDANLKRSAITNGNWLIIFKEPIMTFCDSQNVPSATIFCYENINEILNNATEIYNLIARERVIDTLPEFVLLEEAITLTYGNAIDGYTKGNLIATTKSGTHTGPYYTRTVYPIIILSFNAGGMLRIRNHQYYVEEPSDTKSFPLFEAELTKIGGNLENQAISRLGITVDCADLSDLRTIQKAFIPVGDIGNGGTDRFGLSFRIDTPSPQEEYFIITGTSWFYKKNQKHECRYHDGHQAQAEGAGMDVVTNHSYENFTRDHHHTHCAHAHMKALKEKICYLASFECFLCCKACIFETACLNDGSGLANRAPCS